MYHANLFNFLGVNCTLVHLFFFFYQTFIIKVLFWSLDQPLAHLFMLEKNYLCCTLDYPKSLF